MYIVRLDSVEVKNRITSRDLSPRYEGQWENGRISGYGKLTYANGDEYEGDWQDGRMHGNGVYRYVEGDVYSGEWRDDKRHGKGMRLRRAAVKRPRQKRLRGFDVSRYNRM